MTTCDEIDPFMTPYVDGEVDFRERQAVEAHLARCPPCRERSRTEQAVRRLVRSRTAALTGSAPASLHARCVGLAPVVDLASRPPGRWSRARRWVPWSLAATLLLAVGGVFTAGQQERLEAAFAAQLAIDHEKCFAEFGTGHPPLDAAVAQSHLEAVHGIKVPVPPGEAGAQTALVDARSCAYGGGQMAHLLYEVQGRKVSLFLVPDARPTERSLEVVGHQARLWSSGDVEYVLVGEMGNAEQTAVMDKIAAYMRGYGEGAR